jgi:nucleotide-binding universal stress UspA family protein
MLARIAAEEAADLIVVGACARRRFRRSSFACGLAGELASESPVPVLVAPPSSSRRPAGVVGSDGRR